MKLGVVLLGIVTMAAACKKGGGTGGGGGGGWLVGSSGLMANIHDRTASGYELGSTEQLNAIACRGPGEAWVVGDHATVLYTDDAGETWVAQAVPTTADLRTLATQDQGPVFAAGNGTLLVSEDTGATWRELSDGATHFRSVSAATHGDTVMAIGDNGSVWSYDAGVLSKRATFAGARAVAVAAEGRDIIIAGTGLWRSTNSGATFEALAAPENFVWNEVRLDQNGNAIAVGDRGAVAMISASGQVLTQHVGADDLHALRIAGSAWGDAVSYTAGDRGQVWMSNDGGWSWLPGPNVGRTVLGIDEIGEGHR